MRGNRMFPLFPQRKSGFRPENLSRFPEDARVLFRQEDRKERKDILT